MESNRVTVPSFPLLRVVSNGLEFIKFSHTIFALPFALMSMLIAATGWPTMPILLWILACMVLARTAAMVFNRLVDWELDQTNPRTENRHRLMPKSFARIVLVLSVLLFVCATYQLNFLCLILSPLAIALICFYSITKRFTAYSHLYLGLALAAAPVGAWIAVTGELNQVEPFLLSAAVFFWVAGFDIIYATLDVEFDRAKGLNSIPARFGVERSLAISKILHLMAALLFGLMGWVAGFGWYYGAAWLLVCLGLVWEHKLSHSSDPKTLNQAFFQINAGVSIALLSGVYLEIFLK